MISMARFHETSGVQRPKQSSYSDHAQSSSAPEDSRVSGQSQRTFGPSSAFQFDFRLQSDDLGVKPIDPLVSRRGEPSVEFGLSAFPEPNAASHTDAYPCQHSYEPAPLRIPSHPHPSDHSLSYTLSATSTLASSFADFPPSSDSRSLSPPEPASWTENSSPSLSLSPQDALPNSAPEISFDTRLAHMPFAMNLHTSQPSLQLPVPTHPLRNSGRPGPASGQGSRSPDSDSSDYPPDFPRARIGPNGLAEDQPPTAQGKMRTRVYVACLQCRSRKIRCDGAKPKCQKCTRRSSDCEYDSAPKRRGPDKKPGARQRTSKKAKAAKDEAARSGDNSPLDSWPGLSVKESEGEGEGGRKRRKASGGPSSAPLGWPADADEMESRRGSTGTTSSVEGAAPVTPRDVQSLPIRFTAVPDLADSARESTHDGKVENLLNGFTGSMANLQPPSHDGIPFSFGLGPSANTNLGNARTHDVPPIALHRQQHHTTHYAHPNTSPVSLGLDYFPQARAHITPVDEEDQQEEPQTQRLQHKRKWMHEHEIGSEPSLDFSRKTWWDSLLAMYAPGMDRTATARQVHGDLQFLFKSSNYFVSFFNVPLFFSVFCNPVERDKMQPSLVLAGLAVSTFMRSSEINRGNPGRLRAMWLRDAAQSALEASFNAQWIEPTLAQAAWLLALFEMCAHQYHSSERSNSSMVMLDSIIRSLALTSIDASDPSVSVFSPRTVPVVPIVSPARISGQKGCSCSSLSLGQNSRSSHEHTPLWAATPAWDPDWSVTDIRKEESRRLCWSSLQLAAGHTSHAAAFSAAPLDFFCIQPANYALLFPGEALLQSSSFNASHPAKESIWALYSRAMLLWNSCLRMRGDDVSDNDKAVFAVGAWIESTAIEEALDAHTCGCDQAFLFQGREFLFITRMCISYEFRRFIPHPESEVNGLFNRKKAEAWLHHQKAVAERMMQGLHTVTGHKNNILAQRPFFIWWFMGQVARSLTLWTCDHSLIIALDVCKAFFPPIDYLSCLWPCPPQRTRYLSLHARVTQACRTARIAPPLPPNFDILAPGSPPMTVV